MSSLFFMPAGKRNPIFNINKKPSWKIPITHSAQEKELRENLNGFLTENQGLIRRGLMEGVIIIIVCHLFTQ